jgi:hypothetical protein
MVMGPETKDDYAGEGQKKITTMFRVVTESPTLPLVEEVAPF